MSPADLVFSAARKNQLDPTRAATRSNNVSLAVDLAATYRRTLQKPTRRLVGARDISIFTSQTRVLPPSLLAGDSKADMPSPRVVSAGLGCLPTAARESAHFLFCQDQTLVTGHIQLLNHVPRRHSAPKPTHSARCDEPGVILAGGVLSAISLSRAANNTT